MDPDGQFSQEDLFRVVYGEANPQNESQENYVASAIPRRRYMGFQNDNLPLSFDGIPSMNIGSDPTNDMPNKRENVKNYVKDIKTIIMNHNISDEGIVDTSSPIVQSSPGDHHHFESFVPPVQPPSSFDQDHQSHSPANKSTQFSTESSPSLPNPKQPVSRPHFHRHSVAASPLSQMPSQPLNTMTGFTIDADLLEAQIHQQQQQQKRSMPTLSQPSSAKKKARHYTARDDAILCQQQLLWKKINGKPRKRSSFFTPINREMNGDPSGSRLATLLSGASSVPADVPQQQTPGTIPTGPDSEPLLQPSGTTFQNGMEQQDGHQQQQQRPQAIACSAITLLNDDDDDDDDRIVVAADDDPPPMAKNFGDDAVNAPLPATHQQDFLSSLPTSTSSIHATKMLGMTCRRSNSLSDRTRNKKAEIAALAERARQKNEFHTVSVLRKDIESPVVKCLCHVHPPGIQGSSEVVAILNEHTVSGVAINPGRTLRLYDPLILMKNPDPKGYVPLMICYGKVEDGE